MNNQEYNYDLKLQLDVFCTNLRFDYNKKVVDTFYDKVYYAFFKDDRLVKYDSTFIILHLISVSNNSLERKLLRQFLSYMHTFIDKPLY